jgi:hypothetical protein
MPVGGHTAVTCFVVNAIVKPSFAAATYATATKSGTNIVRASFFRRTSSEIHEAPRCTFSMWDF